MADNGKQTFIRSRFAPWLGLSEYICEPRYEVEPLPASVGEGYRLRLFVLDVAKTREVEIGREIFTPREGSNSSEIYQEASQAGVSWLSTCKSLQEPGAGSGLSLPYPTISAL
jgi:hypothetical protein